ncbi:Phosphoribosylformylglycinamidine synthase subunit PurL [Planctopirus ephydatiae]|uniref:Phosphoribosylformylglycinamidine synthase subunit PurL n=1 Tax=Planctopirus ephydatiae TaxID=2528019 RepID=A0A518GQ55_9PLAN|nr:phosphoribosylformylglycinamidine synthase subunit PurL [Planctopirus ephydatiae]QDV30740.1 Phosphoribosylformylglycinamidine synthase subunit PurL [Planctopirus ephydatiae]
MLWEVEILSRPEQIDREGQRILGEARLLGLDSIQTVRAGRSFLLEGQIDEAVILKAMQLLLVDEVVEIARVRKPAEVNTHDTSGTTGQLFNVLYKPGVTDNTALSTRRALQQAGIAIEEVATCRKYWFDHQAQSNQINVLAQRVLGNDAIERIVQGPLQLATLSFGHTYQLELKHVPIRELDDQALMKLSKEGQLYLSLAEMQTIQKHFRDLQRDPTDIELETVAQTWSEHCSHKTLGGRIRYTDEQGTRQFGNMLKETIFAATQQLRKEWGKDDWCVSVFKDNAGIVTFEEGDNVCIKVETHNHPSAIEPYGGANTGIGGVVRDPLGTGLGAKPVCNTNVFCFAPPDTPHETLPPGVLHPRQVALGVVAGVRDYGNRMGIPTVNGAVFFDERYLGNPLVYCGTVAMIPANRCEKKVSPGELIVALGGRTGRDGIHGATFSSAELTQESETISGGAVQIGNAVTEKMLMDVLLVARDRGLYSAVTDCGAGGFSSAVGEMGEETGAVVWLEKALLKYAGLTYTEIWISEAQERMVLAVPPENWDEFHALCASEGVEATAIGQFTDDHKLTLTYDGKPVGELSMEFLHDGRPPVVREATYSPKTDGAKATYAPKTDYTGDVHKILSSLNVCSKEWIIRQYDHEVQAGSVVKPLVGVMCDGPSDAAVIQPILSSKRGLVISNGMNPHYGDHDPYWMAFAAIDEALRNCVACGADPSKIAILDNFCWGNTERPETLGSLVRAALGCHDAALLYKTPFISGKDSLNNEFSYVDEQGVKQTVAIPSSLLISALGQITDVRRAITMDLKSAGHVLYLIGETRNEFGGSHYALVNDLSGGSVPRVNRELAPRVLARTHQLIAQGLVRSCHDLSEGGLAVALAEMAFAGELGIDIDLGDADATTILFSESTTRFVVEVKPDDEARLREVLAGVPHQKLGVVTETGRVEISGQGKKLVSASNEEFKQSWQAPLAWS